MRVFLTGASGYLGLHVAGKLAAAGHAVTAVARTPGKLGPLVHSANITALEADLGDERRVEAAVQGLDAVVHAALIWGEPREDFELRDTIAAAKLFDAAGRAGVSRALLVSSTAVHFPFRERMNENDRLTTADMYGATKAANELFLWSACASHGTAGVVVRPGPIVGPPAFPGASFRSDSRLKTFVEQARRGEPIQVRSGGRQFAAVEDVARVIVQLIESTRAGETYLCVDREITPWERLARQVVELTDSASPIVTEPASAEEVTPRFETHKLAEHLGITLDSRTAMDAHLSHLIRTA